MKMLASSVDASALILAGDCASNRGHELFEGQQDG